MTTSRKIIIDKYFGRPVVIFLNILARTLGFILKRNHNLIDNSRCIFISKFVGMGSIIQATPLIKTLKINFPGSKIIFLTSASNKPLIERVKYIDEAIYIDDVNLVSAIISTIKALNKFRLMKPDCFIDLEIYSNFSTIISTLSCANNRIGFFRKDSAILMGIYTHMLSFNINAPISKVYLQMARLLGCGNIDEELYDLDIDANKEVSFKIDLLNVNIPYIIINANASDLRIERRWPKENFETLITSLLKQFPNHNFILIGSKNEQSYIKTIQNKINNTRLINTCGSLSLNELIKLIGACELMITNDTGPMHIGFALKVKTIGLFGPCSPKQYGQFENSWCIYKKLYCSPCVHEFLLPPCGGDNQCMKLIEVNEVLNLAVKILNNDSEIFDQPNEIIYNSIGSKFPFGLVRRAT